MEEIKETVNEEVVEGEVVETEVEATEEVIDEESMTDVEQDCEGFDEEEERGE